MRVAIYPGSFDPITLGHLNIIRRTANIFDEVIVCVLHNVSKKNSMFTVEERLNMINKSTKKYANVKVDSYDGLLAEYAKTVPGSVIVKGLRAVSDFEYEFQMASINKTINPELDTMFLTSDGKYTFLSSSAVREMALFGANLKGFVPNEIIQDIEYRAKELREANGK